MSKVEFYSILLTHDFGANWELEGYKRHSLSGKLFTNTVMMGFFSHSFT